jgi:predicted transcriptional regulator YdeE
MHVDDIIIDFKLFTPEDPCHSATYFDRKVTMEPEILHRGAFTILGLQECFTPESHDFEGIWKRFMQYHEQIKAYSIDGAYYGANFVVVEGSQMDYLAGMAISGVQDIPDGLTLREVPASRYVVFQCPVKEISDTYDWIFDVWLKNSPYQRPGKDSLKADFECYPPGTMSGDSLVLLHVALED